MFRVRGVDGREERREGERVEEKVRRSAAFGGNAISKFFGLLFEMDMEGLAALLGPLPEALEMLQGDGSQRVSSHSNRRADPFLSFQGLHLFLEFLQLRDKSPLRRVQRGTLEAGPLIEGFDEDQADAGLVRRPQNRLIQVETALPVVDIVELAHGRDTSS